ISFAVAEGGQVVPRVPKFAEKWFGKNAKKFPDLCFSQTPNSVKNYLLVFSTTRNAFNGIYPTVRTNTTTSTSPVSGSGTVMDTSGGMWTYTYSGTETTTTTTQTQVNSPTRIHQIRFIYSPIGGMGLSFRIGGGRSRLGREGMLQTRLATI